MPDIQPNPYGDDEELQALLEALSEGSTDELATDLLAPKAPAQGADDLASLIEPVAPEYETAGAITGMNADILAEKKPAVSDPALTVDERPVVPDPHDVADTFTTRSPEGTQQLLGGEDNRQNIAAAVQRVGQLYDDPRFNVKTERNVGDYEKEFLSLNKRPTDADFRRQWILASLFGGDGAEEKSREFLTKQTQSFDEGLQKARAMDQHGGRISKPMAELLVSTGSFSPESVVNMRADDPALETLRSLGALGVRTRGQDTSVQTTMMNALVKLLTEREGNQLGFDTKNAQIASNEAIADKYAKKKSGGAGGGVSSTVDPLDAEAYHIAEQRDLPLELAKKFTHSTLAPNEATPEQLEKLSSGRIGWNLMSPKEKGLSVKALEAKLGAEARAPGVVAAKGAADPKKIYDVRVEMQDIGAPLLQAYKGWQRLLKKPTLAAALVKAGQGSTFEQLTKAGMTAEDFKDLQAVKAQVLNASKKISGSAITKTEAPNLASGIGMNMTEDSNFFGSPATLTSYLDNAIQLYNLRARTAQEIYPGSMDWMVTKKGGQQ
jgi:hypothetical protein